MKLRFKSLDLRLAHTWRTARTKKNDSSRHSQVILVELRDGSAFCGLGETAPILRYNESVEKILALFEKIEQNRIDVNDIGAATAYISQVFASSPAAICALDIALHDGVAKLAGMPLHQHLGLGFSEGKHRTSFTIGIDRPEAIREKVQAAEAFPILKMKVGVASDLENLHALREVAPDKLLRVDANEGWRTREVALENICALAADSSVQFVEQPLPAVTSVKDWAWLKARSPLPIFGDESYHSAKDAAVAAECFHGVNVKLVKTGGISGAIEALRAARRQGLKTMLGCMIETSILISAAAQLAELADYLDLDGNLLITNDPYSGVTAERGILSFANAAEKFGLQVSPRKGKVF